MPFYSTDSQYRDKMCYAAKKVTSLKNGTCTKDCPFNMCLAEVELNPHDVALLTHAPLFDQLITSLDLTGMVPYLPISQRRIKQWIRNRDKIEKRLTLLLY